MKLIYEDFVKLAEEKKEIGMKKEIVDGEEVTIFCYNIVSPDLFDVPLAREARGVVFDSNKECICRPFWKLFNLFEREDTQPCNIDWDSLSVVTEKFDGSLVTPVRINNKIYFKTKKTFYSPIAMKLNAMWKDNGAFYEKYFQLINSYDLSETTLLFEYTSPSKQIVLKYDKEELIFLGERKIKDGKFYPSADIIVDVIPSKSYAPDFDFNKFINRVKLETDREGYVIYAQDRLRAYKIKTEWYMDRHHLLSSLSYRNVLKLIVEEKLDDIISELRNKEFFKQVELVESIWNEYSKEWDELYTKMFEIFDLITKGKSITRKEFAAFVMKNYTEYQCPLFNVYENKMEWLAKSVQDLVIDKLKERYKGKIIFMGELQE